MNRSEKATDDYPMETRTNARVLSTQLDEQQAYIAQRYEDAYDRLYAALCDIDYVLTPLKALEGAERYAAHEEIVTLEARHKRAMYLVDCSIAHARRVYTHLIGSFDPLCSEDSDTGQITGQMHVGEVHRYRDEPGAALEDARTRHIARMESWENEQQELWDDGGADFPEPQRRYTDADYQTLADQDRAFEKLLALQAAKADNYLR